MGGGDVHILHITFTLPVGCHPNQTVVLILLLCSHSRFLAG
jgi:hypothetical protein